MAALDSVIGRVGDWSPVEGAPQRGYFGNNLHQYTQARAMWSKYQKDEQKSSADAAAAKAASDAKAADAKAFRAEQSQLAKDFMGKWDQSIQEAKGMQSQAMSFINDPNFGGYNDLADDVKGDLDAFKQTWGGVEQESASLAKHELGLQRQMGDQLADLTQADYGGVAGKAMQDVASQAESGRQSEGRRLQSLGIDPTSGKYRQMMSKSRGSEALNRAQAANQARTGEKQRVTGAVTSGLQNINASQTAGVGTGIAKQRSGLRDAITGIKNTQMSAKLQAGGLATNVANSYLRAGEGFAGAAGAHTGLSMPAYVGEDKIT